MVVPTEPGLMIGIDRLKDIEWTEKKLEALKKIFKGATGNASLADKAKKLEIVSQSHARRARWLTLHYQDTVAKVLEVLSVQNKDVRKAEWNNKEVSFHPFELVYESWLMLFSDSSISWTNYNCWLLSQSFTWSTYQRRITLERRTSGEYSAISFDPLLTLTAG